MRIGIRSAVPGRVRWDVPGLLNRPDLARSVTNVLQAYPGVTSVAANPVTGRVLTHFAPQVPIAALQAALEGALSRPVYVPEPRAAVVEEDADREAPHLTRLLTRTRRHQELAQKAVGLAAVNRLFEIAPTAMISTALDVVTRGSSSMLGRLGFATVRSQIAALGVISLAVWTLDSLFGYLYSVAAADLSTAVQHDLRNEVYQHLQNLDIAAIEEQPVTEWMGVLQADISRIGSFIEDGIDPIVTMIANTFTVSLTYIAVSPPIAAVQLLIVPGLYFVSTRLLEPIRQRQVVSRREQMRLAALLHGNVAGMSTIVSSSRQPTEAERVEEQSEKVRHSARQMLAYSATYVPAIQMVVGAGFVTTLVWGGLEVDRGKIAPGAYNLMSFSALRLMAALGRMGVTLEQYQRTKVSLARVLGVLDRAPEIVGGTRPLPPDWVTGELVLDNVNFSYEPGQPVLKGLSMRIPAGQTVGLVGQTGAGKTSVLKLLQRFYDVDAGAIRLDGVDLREYKLDDLRRSYTVVPQRFFLFPGTIRENIAYVRPEATLEEVEQAARVAEAHEFISELPAGYDTELGEEGLSLSGGQQQRLAIARAVLADRPILLFDEATSSLDHETEASVQRSLQEVTAGRTTVVVAHRLSTIRHADIIYVLDDGQVREAGSHDELLQADGIYAGLWRVQTGETRPARRGDAASDAASDAVLEDEQA